MREPHFILKHFHKILIFCDITIFHRITEQKLTLHNYLFIDPVLIQLVVLFITRTYIFLALVPRKFHL